MDILLNRRFIVTGLLVLFSVGFLGLFSPGDTGSSSFQVLLVSIAFFLVVPVLYSKIVLKESLKNLGWQSGNIFLGIFSAIVCITFALGVVFLLSRYTAFEGQYLFPATVQKNFLWFAVYELVLVAFMALLYEMFFRGLVQLLWLRRFGLLGVLFQALLFTLLLYLADDISWQRLPVLLFAPLSGIIAYYSQSLWYSWAASWIFFFLTDIYLLVIH